MACWLGIGLWLTRGRWRGRNEGGEEMREETKYGTRYLYPENPAELIGRIISNYDPDRCDKILPDGRWASDAGYDEDCEDHYIITGVVKTTHEWVIFGHLMRSYDEAYDKVARWDKEGCPIALLRDKQMEQLLERLYCIGKEMRGERLVNEETKNNPPLVGYRPASKVLRWDLYHDSAEEFAKMYEED